jgi:hypothetical protein
MCRNSNLGSQPSVAYSVHGKVILGSDLPELAAEVGLHVC